MARIFQNRQRSRWLSAVGSLGLVALAASASPSAHAQGPVDLTGTFFQSGGVFDYNFSVTNRGTTTIADINFFVATGANAVTNLSAPPGFQSVFDPGLGLVDFLPTNPLTNGDFTPGRTVSGFMFRSSTSINGRPFTALDENGGTFNGTIQLTQTAAPEPGTLGFIALAGAPFAAAVVSRRRRLAVSRSLKG